MSYKSLNKFIDLGIQCFYKFWFEFLEKDKLNFLFKNYNGYAIEIGL